MKKKDQNIQDFCRDLATALQRIQASELNSDISIKPMKSNEEGRDEKETGRH